MGGYFIHVLHALTKYVREMAVVSIPEKKFKREIRNVFVKPLELTEDEAFSESFEDRLLSDIDVEMFFDALESRNREILRMKLEGYQQKEIAEALGVSESQVSRRLDQIRDAYLCRKRRCGCAV